MGNEYPNSAHAVLPAVVAVHAHETVGEDPAAVAAPEFPLREAGHAPLTGPRRSPPLLYPTWRVFPDA